MKYVIDQITGLSACILIRIDGRSQRGIANPIHRRHASGIKPCEPVLAPAFGLVQRQICAVVQLLIAAAVPRINCHTDAAGHLNRLLFSLKQVLKQLQQLPGLILGNTDRRKILEKHGELISADPADHIRFTRYFLHACRQLRQNRISEQVPLTVIYQLEIIHIYDKHGTDCIRLIRQVQLRPPFRFGMVIKACQSIQLRPSAQFLHHPFFFVNI